MKKKANEFASEYENDGDGNEKEALSREIELDYASWKSLPNTKVIGA